MSEGKIVLSVLVLIGGFAGFLNLFTSTMVPTEQVDETVTIFEMSRPRAPAEARKLINPIAVSREAVEAGDALYHGKGNCFVCHGDLGKGDGSAGVLLAPAPRDLTNPNFQMLRKDGEIFWAMKYGVEATGMFALVPRMITEEEAWTIVHYVRSLRP